ncbi:hypothetical protein [Thermococcus sp.]
MRKSRAVGISLVIAFISISTYYWINQNSEFNSLITSHPHALGGIFTGNSTYYEYYQVNTTGGTRYYQVIKSENGKILKIKEISYSDYLVYTGKALDMARSLVEEKASLPVGATLITYNVTNLTVWLYYSIGGNETDNGRSESNVTSTLPSPGKEFTVARVNLTSENVSVRIVPFEELPRWVQNVVKELRELKG